MQKDTLRITLKEIKPAIWRKIEVPSNITLRHPGDLICNLMGWAGYHLNQFRKGNDYYMPAYQRDGEEDYIWNCNNYNQEDVTIADILPKKLRPSSGSMTLVTVGSTKSVSTSMTIDSPSPHPEACTTECSFRS